MTNKTAIIYARVSTSRQAEEELSVPAQIEHGHRKAAEEGARVLRVFTDEGASAFYNNRPAFDDALLFCELHRVDLFICWSPSRFSRNRVDAGLYKRRLADCGTDIRYVSMRIDPSTTEGFVLDAMMELFSEMQSRETRADTLRSMIRNAQSGYWGGGRPPFGYRAEPAPDNPKRKRLAPEPDEAPLAVRIFELADQGLGGRAIASWLNSHGYTNRGSKWSKTVVGYLLRNQVMIGRVVFGRTDRRTGRQRPRADWIVVDSHAPIIPIDLWGRVQERLTEAAPGAADTPSNSTWRLSGLLRCGQCGAPMHIEQATGRSRVYPYYLCSAAKADRAHQVERVRADRLEPWLVEQIAERLFSREFLADTARELERSRGSWEQERRRQRDALARHVREVERRNQKIYELLELFGKDAPNLADVTRRLRANNEELARLEQQLAEIEDATPPEPALDSRIEELRDLALEVLLESDDGPGVRAFLGEFIDSIDLSADVVRIHYRPDVIASGSAAVHSVTMWLPGAGALRTIEIAPPAWWPLAA